MSSGTRGLMLGVSGGAALLALLLFAVLRSQPEAQRDAAEPSDGGQAATRGLSAETSPSPLMSVTPETAGDEVSARVRAPRETRGRVEREETGTQRGEGTRQYRSGEVAETAATDGVGATFGLESLIDSGVPHSEAEWVWDRHAATERERARLRSLLAEGRGTVEDRRALLELDDALIQDIGSDNYDRLLYAAGNNNRVMVGIVHPGSNGAVAGLMQGDLVLLIDGTPVYTAHDLRARATQRISGQPTVTIVYQRGSEWFETEIRTGALGMGLRGHREQP